MKSLAAAFLALALPAMAQSVPYAPMFDLPEMPAKLIPPPGKARCLFAQEVCALRMDEYLGMNAEIVRLTEALEKLTESCVAKLEVVPKKSIPIDPATQQRS